MTRIKHPRCPTIVRETFEGPRRRIRDKRDGRGHRWSPERTLRGVPTGSSDMDPFLFPLALPSEPRDAGERNVAPCAPQPDTRHGSRHRGEGERPPRDRPLTGAIRRRHGPAVTKRAEECGCGGRVAQANIEIVHAGWPAEDASDSASAPSLSASQTRAYSQQKLCGDFASINRRSESERDGTGPLPRPAT